VKQTNFKVHNTITQYFRKSRGSFWKQFWMWFKEHTYKSFSVRDREREREKCIVHCYVKYSALVFYKVSQAIQTRLETVALCLITSTSTILVWCSYTTMVIVSKLFLKILYKKNLSNDFFVMLSLSLLSLLLKKRKN
jgi:hypothetical protein